MCSLIYYALFSSVLKNKIRIEYRQTNIKFTIVYIWVRRCRRTSELVGPEGKGSALQNFKVRSQKSTLTEMG